MVDGRWSTGATSRAWQTRARRARRVLWGRLSEKKAGVLDELAAERAKALEKESAELQKEAERLAREIGELAGESPGRIG